MPFVSQTPPQAEHRRSSGCDTALLRNRDATPPADQARMNPATSARLAWVCMDTAPVGQLASPQQLANATVIATQERWLEGVPPGVG